MANAVKNVAFSLLIAAVLTGCTAPLGKWTGPETAAPFSAEPWSYNGEPGKVLRTAHYLIHTTITDPQSQDRLAQIMEGGNAQYRSFAGDFPTSEELLRCYVFARRQEWADFTQRNTGADASIYLQISRGGYTIGDWFVSYSIGEKSNHSYSVAAHEGWHQFVARHFKTRLPPFLEEGTACMFETVEFVNDLPRWNTSINPARVLALRNTIDEGKLWPLEKLITMHAGDVVRLPGDRIEAFYSQSWAFARFMCEYNKGEYLPAFRRMLADTARGDPNDTTQAVRKALNLWSPASVKPLLERYLGKQMGEIDREYQQFIRHVAFEQLQAQWAQRAS